MEADRKEEFRKGPTSHWKPDLVEKSSANGGTTMRHMLYKSCSRLVLIIKNKGFVSKDCVIREGFMHRILKMMVQIPLGGWVNCSLMAVEDELPFWTLPELMRCHSSVGHSCWGECSPKQNF